MTKLTLPSSKVDIALAAGSTDAAMKAAEAKSTKLYNVPVAAIKPIDGFNVRVNSADYLAHRDMLVASIKANGFDQTKPLAGYVAKDGDKNVIFVTDGYTRLDAVNTFNADPDTAADDEIKVLPVLIRTPAPSLTDLTVALHTNNTGRPLTPFELGVVVKRLLREDGVTKAIIATRLAITPRYVDDVLLLVNGPKAVREAVLDGTVSSTMAIQELRKAGDNPDAAVERITAAVSKAKAAGKTKATRKDTGPKMVKVKHSISVAAGTDMKDIVKAAAAHIRATVASVPHATDPEAKVADTDGSITLTIEVPAPEPVKAAPKAKPAKKAAAKPAKPAKKAAAAKAEPKAEAAQVKPAKKAAAKKAEKPAKPAKKAAEPVDADDADEDIGIVGAEEVSSEGEDDEPAQVPPIVKSDADVPEDEETDI